MKLFFGNLSWNIARILVNGSRGESCAIRLGDWGIRLFSWFVKVYLKHERQAQEDERCESILQLSGGLCKNIFGLTWNKGTSQVFSTECEETRKRSNNFRSLQQFRHICESQKLNYLVTLLHLNSQSFFHRYLLWYSTTPLIRNAYRVFCALSFRRGKHSHWGALPPPPGCRLWTRIAAMELNNILSKVSENNYGK